METLNIGQLSREMHLDGYANFMPFKHWDGSGDFKHGRIYYNSLANQTDLIKERIAYGNHKP